MVDRLAHPCVAVEADVRAAIERDALLPAASRVVVAVSGGADSLCLLGTLAALCGPGRAWPGVELVVAHLDHGLRGEAARADAVWVAGLADQLGAPSRLGACDVAALASREGRSIEDAGRVARYRFLREVAASEGAARIFVGHTHDDQVETLIMQWLRGSGLAGLAGMRPLEGEIARPLLTVTRAQTHAYCAARGWTPREDPTNADLRYRRNRVRHELIPLLARYNPNLGETLTRNARLLADDERYLEEQAQRAWSDACREVTAERIVLGSAALMALPPALRRRVLRRAASMLAAGEPVLEARHVAILETLLAHARGSRSVHLPAGVCACTVADTLVFERRPAAAARAARDRGDGPVARPDSVALPVPGCVAVPGTGWRVRAELLDPAAGSPPPGAERLWTAARPLDARGPRPALGTATDVGQAELRAYLDADVAGEPLSVCTWQPGDRFQPLGMQREKKLQDYFVDAKVPHMERERIPLVWGPRHLLWVAGHRLDDRARLTMATRRVLALRLEPDGPWRGPDVTS